MKQKRNIQNVNKIKNQITQKKVVIVTVVIIMTVTEIKIFTLGVSKQERGKLTKQESNLIRGK